MAEVTSYSYEWIRKLVGRYNQGGPEVMRSSAREPVPAPLLDAAAQQALPHTLEHESPQQGEHWDGARVAE